MRLPLLAVAVLTAPAFAADPPPTVVTSPDGRVRVEVTVVGGEPRYQVAFAGKPVVLPSRLGATLADGSRLGAAAAVGSVETTAADSTYRQFPGKRSQARDHYNQARVTFREAGGKQWRAVVRAYDDGAAVRYEFPAQPGWDKLELKQDDTRFQFPAGAAATALPLNGFATSHEKRYDRRPVADVPADWLLGLPLLVELPGTGWAAVTEANLTDYAGMYLAKPTGGAALEARLSPRPDKPGVAVAAALPHASPWRVIMVGATPGRLVESDLVLNLNAPNAVGDTSWVKPGKTTFPWWNGFYEENVPFKPGLNTATTKHYIDFCAEAGIPYHSLDGVGDTAWYGGPIVPYAGADPAGETPGLDRAAVFAHAKSKGVRLRLWMHWQAAEKHMGRVFPLYREWGAEGVMIDFMDRDDQAMVQFQHRLLKLAAANKLTVTLHGCGQPTGLERTYPHLLNHEAVMNLEYDKWDKAGVTPDHETTVPFTRMLAGPLDFHQGSFRAVRPAAFKPRNDAPLVIGTPARTLASYVVYQNHLPMAADYPSAYRRHTALAALAALAAVPCTWDDTKVLTGEVGRLAVVARRSGAEWWVGGMNGADARLVDIPLRFLPPGRFTATVYSDDAAAPLGLELKIRAVTAADAVRADLVAAGGVVVRLVPARR